MLKKINATIWLALTIIPIGMKLFVLPDTSLSYLLCIGMTIICGLGALWSLNSDIADRAASTAVSAGKTAMTYHPTQENYMPQIPTNLQVVEAFCGSNVVQPKELQMNLEKAGWHVSAATAGIADAIDNGVVKRTVSGGLQVASPAP